MLERGDVERVAGRLVPRPPRRVEALAEDEADLDVGHALANLQGLVHRAHEDGVAAIVREADTIMLSPGGHRQEVIAHGHSGRGQEEVLDDAELDALAQSVMPTLGLSRAGGRQEVGAVEPSHAELIRLVRLHGVQGLVRLSGSHTSGQTRPLGSTDTKRPDLVGHSAALLHTPLAEESGRGTEGQTTRGIDGTGHGSEKNHRLGQLNAVLVLVECQTPSPADGTLGAEDVSDALNRGNVDRGDLGDLLDGILGGASLELVETVDPLLHELMIILIVLEHEVHDAESHAGVGLRTELDVDVAIARTRPGDAGVNGNQVRAKLHHVNEDVTEETVTIGGQRLLTPNDNPLGELVRGILETTRQVACRVELGVASTQDVVSNRAARAIAGPAGLRVAAVGRLQDGERQCIVENASLTAGATKADDGLGTIRGLVVADLLANRVESLVPRGALPLHLTAILIGALHGIDDAVGAVGVLAQSKVHGVDATLRNGVVVVTLDADETAAVGDNLNAISYRVRSRGRPGVAAGSYSAILACNSPLFAVSSSHSVTPFPQLPFGKT